MRRLRFPVLSLQAGFQSITGASTLIRLPDIKCRPQKELSHYSVLNFHLIFSSSSSSCESLPRRKKKKEEEASCRPDIHALRKHNNLFLAEAACRCLVSGYRDAAVKKPASSWADRNAWGMEGVGTIRWTLSAPAAGIRCYARLATGQPGLRAIDCAEILSTVIKELCDASSVS